MSRILRLGIVAMGIVATFAWQQGAASADAADPPPAVENLSRCIRQSQQLAAVILMDQSKSLRDTDKFGRRSLLGAALVDALSAATGFEIEDRSSRVDLLVAGFGSALTSASGAPVSEADWITLGTSTLPQVDEQLAGFANRNGDEDTDYVDALTGAMGSLARHVAQMEQTGDDSVCRLVLWFTDGKFDISPSPQRRPWAQDIPLNSRGNAAKAIARGRELLCAPQGVANELRRQSTFVFTLGLTSPKFTGDDERLLRSVTLGTQGCGETDGSSLGWYLGDGDIESLRQCVVKVFSGLPCGPNPEAVTCTASSPCEYRFRVDDSVASVSGYAITSPAAGRLVLVLPDGHEIEVNDRRNELNLDGAIVRVEGSAGFYRIDANLEQNVELSGEWVLRFAPEGSGSLDSQVTFRSSYSFSLTAPESVLGFDEVEATIQLTGRGGAPLSAAGLNGSAEFVVEVVQGSRQLSTQVSELDSSGRATARFTPEREEASATMEVVVTGTAAIADGKRVDLGQRRSSISVVFPGFGRPPKSINVGLVEARRAKERLADNSQPVLPFEMGGLAAEFKGPDKGNGQACLSDVRFDGAVGRTATLTFASAGKCIDLAEGEAVEIPLSFRIDEPTAGHLSGTADFSMTNLTTGEQRVLSVPLEGEVVVPAPDPWTDEKLLWGLLVGGLLLLALAWVVGAWWASGLGRDVAEVKVFTTPARLTDGHLQVAAPGDDWQYVTKDGWREASTSKLLFNSPVAFIRENRVDVTSVHSDAALMGSMGHHARRRRAMVRHGLSGQWVFVARASTSTEVEMMGELHVLLHQSATGFRGPGAPHPSAPIIAEASKALPQHFHDLRGMFGQPDAQGNEPPNGLIHSVGYGRKDP